MRIGKTRHLVFDFGTSHIRAIELVPGRNGKTFGISFYQQYDAPEFGYDERISILRTEGKAFISSLQAKRASVSLPGRGILVRFITVPKVPLGKLRDILKFEIQQQIPFPIEVVSWAYQIISETDKSFQVLLCAAKKDLINDYIAHIVPFGLAIENLDTDFFAMYNLYRLSPLFNSQECQGILDLGAQSANLIINHQEKILMRSLTTTGDVVSSTLVDSQRIEFAEAEKIKKQQGMNSPAVASIMDSLNTELQNSIDYWRFTLKGTDLNRFFICGGMSKMIGLREYLQQKLKVPVDFLNPLDFCNVDPEYEELLADKGHEIVVACGVGLKALNKASVVIDMLPVEFLRMRELAENRPYIFLSIIMTLLLTMTPLFFLRIDKTACENYKTELETALKEYEQFKPQVEALQKSINDVKGKIGVLQNLFEKKYLWLSRILEVGNTLPSSRVYLTSLYPTGAQIAQAAAAQPQAPQPPAPGAPPAPGVLPAPEVPPAPGVPPGPGAPPEPPPVPAEPAPVQQAAPAGPPSSLPESISVLTLEGEVISIDIRSAFTDFKTFVQRLSNLDFLSEVVIESCELDRATDKLKFLLTAKLK